MDIRDSVELVIGVPVIVITPAIVELAKQMGLPVRFAGVVAIVAAMLLLACGDLALAGAPPMADLAQVLPRWVLGGVVYGLAATGLYSQTRQLGGKNAAL